MDLAVIYARFRLPGMPTVGLRASDMATHGYATPADDLNAWRSAARVPETLPPHLLAHLQGGVFPTIGVRGCDGRGQFRLVTQARVALEDADEGQSPEVA